MTREDPIAPRGMFQGRMDDKGRLKFPAAIRGHFEQIGAARLFVTSLDRRTVRVYPLDAWARVEASLAQVCDTPESAEMIAFNAADLGWETEIDGQGRIVLPPELRRAAGIDNSGVRLYFLRDHLRVISEAEYEQMKRAAEAAAAPPLHNEPCA